MPHPLTRPSGLPRRAATLTAVALAALVTALRCLAADAPALPDEALVLPPVGGGGRTPVAADAVAAQIVAGKWQAPKAGDAVTLPDGATRKWEPLKAEKPGSWSGRALGGGYAYFSVTAPADAVMLLQASGHSMVYVNGEPRAGDPYQHGYVKLPVLLHKGENELLFQVGRGQLSAKLEEVKSDALFNTADVTLPTLLVGRKTQTWGGVVVVNATPRPLELLTLEAALSDAPPTMTDIPTLPPLAVRKVAFRLEGAAPKEGENTPLQLRLLRKTVGKPDVLDASKLELASR